jgi:basic membrane protein A
MARTYPTPYFIGLDQEQLPDQDLSPNLVGLVFAEDQIGYLAGALAAMLTKTGQIGAVFASDELPFIKRYGDGYRAGAATTDPDVVVTVVYHNDVDLQQSFSDPQWGATTANSLIDAQVDIVFGFGGTTGSDALTASAMRSVYVIGADIDQYYALPVSAPFLYTSFVKMIAPGIADLISAAKEAQIGIAPFPSGIYSGQVGLAPYHELGPSIPEEVKSRIDTLYQALLSGEIQTGASIIRP